MTESSEAARTRAEKMCQAFIAVGGGKSRAPPKGGEPGGVAPQESAKTSDLVVGQIVT